MQDLALAFPSQIGEFLEFAGTHALYLFDGVNWVPRDSERGVPPTTDRTRSALAFQEREMVFCDAGLTPEQDNGQNQSGSWSPFFSGSFVIQLTCRRRFECGGTPCRTSVYRKTEETMTAVVDGMSKVAGMLPAFLPNRDERLIACLEVAMKYCLLFFVITSQTSFARDGIELFRDRYFNGYSERLYETDSDLYDNRIGRGRIASIRVPRGCSAVLFEKTNFKGRSITLSHNADDLSRMLPERIGSVRLLWAQSQPARGGQWGGRSERRSDRGVVFYEHPDFRGRQQAFSQDVGNLRGTHIGNDTISSLTVPRGYTVILYEHKNFRGRSEEIRGNDRNLKNNSIGADRVSSFRIQRTYGDRRESRGITLFDATGFAGRSQTFNSDVRNLRNTHIGNDAVNSILVPRGYVVTLYAHKNFKGRSETFRSDDRNLANNHIGTNRASSLRIHRADDRESRHGGSYRDDSYRDDSYRDDSYRDYSRRGGRGKVRLFRQVNYRGDKLGVSHDIANLSDTRLGNDTLSSIKVPEGWRVTLYRRANFRGRSVVLEGNAPDLHGSPVGDNSVSSIRVEWVGY